MEKKEVIVECIPIDSIELVILTKNPSQFDYVISFLN
jgi:hypothetical protein